MPLSPTFPDIASLDLYVSVIELGSLSRAAVAHGVAQASASGRIRHMERQLGLTLLERSPAGSTPTDDGVVVAGWAQNILRAAQELEAGLVALKSPHTERLRVSSSFTIAEYLLPMWLERLSRSHPDDSVALKVANSTAVLASLRAGEADIGFVETPTATPGMHERVVAHDELVTVVAPSHSWASRSRVPLRALVATPLIMREEGSGTREALDAHLRDRDLPPPQSVLELGSTSAVRSAVANGNSPTVISRLAVATDLTSGQLIEVNVTDLNIRRRLRAVWMRGRTPPPLAQDLLELADQAP